MNVFAVGCSWSQHWPRWLTCDARSVACDGCGLWAFSEHIESNLHWADAVVVQLPTPLRSYRTGPDWACKTLALFREFVQSLTPNRVLLDKYRTEMLGLSRYPKRIVFLEFNTAGYPFRHPHDFGETCSGDMQNWALGCGVEYLRVDLSHQPGMCLVESKEPVEHPAGWSVLSPPGLFVHDGHPSEAAQRLAAQTVEAYLCGGG